MPVRCKGVRAELVGQPCLDPRDRGGAVRRRQLGGFAEPDHDVIHVSGTKHPLPNSAICSSISAKASPAQAADFVGVDGSVVPFPMQHAYAASRGLRLAHVEVRLGLVCSAGKSAACSPQPRSPTDQAPADRPHGRSLPGRQRRRARVPGGLGVQRLGAAGLLPRSG
jgi:hypothetical protein